MWAKRDNRRHGSLVGIVAVALVAVVGAVALSFDLGRVVSAAQRTQDVADSAALAAVQTFSTDALGEARWRVDTTVSANNIGTGLTVACSTAEGSSDFILYNVGDTVLATAPSALTTRP